MIWFQFLAMLQISASDDVRLQGQSHKAERNARGHGVELLFCGIAVAYRGTIVCAQFRTTRPFLSALSLLLDQRFGSFRLRSPASSG